MRSLSRSLLVLVAFREQLSLLSAFAHVHSFIGHCLSLPLFHDSIPSFRLRYRSSVDQTSCSQPAVNFLFHSTRLGGATSLDFRRNPYAPLTLIPRRKLTPSSIFIPSDYSILVLCLADYFLTIITTSHRLRWTFTFDSIRLRSLARPVSIHKLHKCSNQRIPKCPRHLRRLLRLPQLTVQHPADRRAKAPSLNSKRIKNDREPHRTNCLR